MFNGSQLSMASEPFRKFGGSFERLSTIRYVYCDQTFRFDDMKGAETVLARFSLFYVDIS